MLNFDADAGLGKIYVTLIWILLKLRGNHKMTTSTDHVNYPQKSHQIAIK